MTCQILSIFFIWINLSASQFRTGREFGCTDWTGCIVGTVCIQNECVVLSCQSDRNCPLDHECLDFGHLNQLTTETDKRCSHQKNRNLDSTMQKLNHLRSCRRSNDCSRISHHECFYSSDNRQGICRAAYGNCTHSRDCPSSHTTCLENKCYCTQMDEIKGRCGNPCELDKGHDQCEESCQVCYHGMCQDSPALKNCHQRTDYPLANTDLDGRCDLGISSQCCADAECIARCEGTFCHTISGTCQGPLPWFCSDEDLSSQKNNQPSNTRGNVEKSEQRKTHKNRFCKSQNDCQVGNENRQCCKPVAGFCAEEHCKLIDENLEDLKGQLSQKIQIVYLSDDKCACYCNYNKGELEDFYNREKRLGTNDCPPGFSTSTLVTYDEDQKCSCDCNLVRKSES